MARSVKKFCSINQWLEKVDKKLYKVFDDLCLHRLLVPTRGTSGITFLYPSDAAYKKEIMEAAYSDNPEKAVQMLQALALKTYLPSAKHFVEQKTDIPNKLNQRVEIGRVEATKIHLKCGGTLVLPTGSKKFTPRKDRENMAVWMYTGSKMMPLDGKASVGPAKKVGGNYSIESKAATPDTMAAIDIGDQKAAYDRGTGENRFAERVLSFFHWAIKNDDLAVKYGPAFKPVPEFAYANLRARLKLEPVDFAMWMENTGGIYLSQDADIHKEYSKVQGEFAAKYFTAAQKEYAKHHADLVKERSKVARSNRPKLPAKLAKLYGGDVTGIAKACDLACFVRHDRWADLVEAEAAGRGASAILDEIMQPIEVAPVRGGKIGGVAEYMSGEGSFARTTYAGYAPIAAGGGAYEANGEEFGEHVGGVVDEYGVPSIEPFNLVGGHMAQQAERTGKAHLLRSHVAAMM